MLEIEMELAAANPAPTALIAGLPLADAERELLGEIAAEPARAPRRVPRPRRRHVALLAAAVAAAAAAIAVVGDSDQPGKPEPAFAAELVRFAERSPLLLVGDPTWHIYYADEETAKVGEFQLRQAGGGIASLNWQNGPLGGWKRDRANSADLVTSARVLGTTATVYRYDASRSLGGKRDITALWVDRGRVLEFRATVADMAAFRRLLGSLKRVDTTTWLEAMPPNVVKAADHDKVVAEMLKGIPLPPGFDPADIRAKGLTKDRYQLAATVAGTVACTWFQRWGQARRDGNDAGVREAIAAMRTAKSWPVLRQMSKQGAYPEVLEGYVAAMPSGRWYGRPLLGDVESGLGCSERGVELGP
jgi:hypothetical protein